MVANDLLDLAVLLELLQSLAGQAAVDLETVNQGGDSDQTEVLDILLETLSGLLLKDDVVVGLVLDCGCQVSITVRRWCSNLMGSSRSEVTGMGWRGW